MDNGYGIVLFIFGICALAFSIFVNIATRKQPENTGE